jgi:hypothetical protein
MLQNITFSANKDLIQRARQKASAENTTLNDVFRQWLAKYIERPVNANEYESLMETLAYVKTGAKLTRDELNER